MASGFEPFCVITASTSGKSISVAAVSTSSSPALLDSTGVFTPAVLVTNTSAVTLFVRMSAEAVPVATSTDVPIPANSARVFANPNSFGKTGLAVTGIGQGNGVVVFTPGIN